jgi:DNA polymerase-4
VGVSGLADWTQDDLFGELIAAHPDDDPDPASEAADTHAEEPAPRRAAPSWIAGQDVTHATMGRGWVQGAGAGWVTVRFETRVTAVGRVRSFRIHDAQLAPAPPFGTLSPAER